MARKLQEEFEIWGLEMNTQKTNYLPIGTNNATNIKLENGEVLNVCYAQTYLGVIFD